MKELLYKVLYNGVLVQEDFDLLMRSIMNKTAKDIHMAALFGVWNDRPLDGRILHMFCTALEKYTVKVPGRAIDLCGTGGSGHSALNISTAASLVVAAAGVPVAKHGGRSLAGSGSADVLEALGATLEMSGSRTSKCLKETGFTFLFAPAYNPVLKAVQGFRKAYGFHTLWNWAAPLVNPVKLSGQLIGLPECHAQDEYSFAAAEKEHQTTILVSGADGLDEATTTSNTHVTIIRRDRTNERFVIRPHEIEMEPAPLWGIKGGNAKYNAAALRRLLHTGERGYYRDIVLLNAGLALKAAGRMQDRSVLACVEAVTPFLDNGKAEKVLDGFIQLSREG